MTGMQVLLTNEKTDGSKAANSYAFNPAEEDRNRNWAKELNKNWNYCISEEYYIGVWFPAAST